MLERNGLSAVLAALSGVVVVGCMGLLGGSDEAGEAAPAAEVVAPSGLRRLTVAEYDNTVRDLLGDASRPAAALMPEDARTPFDNDYAGQVPSGALIDGAEALAMQLARSLLADPPRRDQVVGCVPAAPEDAVCLEHFVRTFGRRALRRPLRDAEVAEYLELQAFAAQTNDFYLAVETILWAFLQDPEFLYRVEVGRAVGDAPMVRLNSYEVASRLSFLLWGSTPDDALLDAALAAETAGRPLGPTEVRALAQRMLDDDRARAQVKRFHALWLGYEVLPHEPALAEDMQRETEALIDRIIFDDARPWRDLLALEETFLTAALADHYTLPAPASPEGGWVPLTGTGRKGLLSQGSFLSHGGGGTDTSPTRRGLAVLGRLLCQPQPEPPPNVNIDDPPEGSGPCKWQQLSAYREPGCAGCHDQMDPVGWGLEHYDGAGRFRETDLAGCSLEEHTLGALPSLGSFRGPAELSDLLIDSAELHACLGTQVLRFVTGRSELTAADRAIAGEIVETAALGFRFQDLLLAVVSSPSFVYRNLED